MLGVLFPHCQHKLECTVIEVCMHWMAIHGSGKLSKI